MALPVGSKTTSRTTTIPALGRHEAPASESIHRVVRVAAKVVAGIGIVLLVMIAGLATVLAQPYWPMLIGLLVTTCALGLGILVSKRFVVGLAVLAVVVTGVVTFSQVSASTPPITDAEGHVIPGASPR